MSTLAARLGKLTPALTGKERAILVIKAHAADQEPDPLLRRFDSPAELSKYDRCIALCIAANNELGAVINVIAMVVAGLDRDLYRVKVLIEAEETLRRAIVAGELEARGRGKAVRIRRSSFDS